MPRSFTAGNGEMFVGLDSNGQVRDLYYPHVGLENHVGQNRRHRMGVYVDGRIHWLSDTDFVVSIEMDNETLESHITARNEKIEVTVHMDDVVYNEKPIFVRNIQIENSSDRDREIKVFFCHEFEMTESQRAATAYLDPENKCLIHYQGRRVFLINAIDEDGGFSEFTTGVYGIEGKDGSWRDAEDGLLSGNPIEHGPIDSCFGLAHNYKAGELHEYNYWIAAGNSIDEVVNLNNYVLRQTPKHLLQTTTDYWHAWLERRPFHFHDLSEEVIDLFKRSLLIISSHVDKNGAILASGDSGMLQWGKDGYGYVWPRDGSYIAGALDAVGDWNVTHRFYEFLANVIGKDGYLMHKYGPDGSLGSSWHPWLYDGEYQLPIQEDETATALHALWNHYEFSKDLEFVERLYNPFIRRSADFLVSFRHEKSGLPKRSYDLWEERMGIHTYTVASVYGGLMASGKFARLLGKVDEARHYESVAEEIKTSILEFFYKDGYFIRGGQFVDGEFKPSETIDSSSTFGVWHFGVLPPYDDRVISSMEHVQERLKVQEVGGLARYHGDQYYRNDRLSEDIPGNPWFITTLWRAQHVIACAESEADLEEARHVLGWVTEHASRSGTLSEQLDPITGGSLSASPLTWSHATFVSTVISYLNKLKDLGVCDNCNPVQINSTNQS